jgi:hypothetical protein
MVEARKPSRQSQSNARRSKKQAQDRQAWLGRGKGGRPTQPAGWWLPGRWRRATTIAAAACSRRIGGPRDGDGSTDELSPSDSREGLQLLPNYIASTFPTIGGFWRPFPPVVVEWASGCCGSLGLVQCLFVAFFGSRGHGWRGYPCSV